MASAAAIIFGGACAAYAPSHLLAHPRRVALPVARAAVAPGAIIFVGGAAPAYAPPLVALPVTRAAAVAPRTRDATMLEAGDLALVGVSLLLVGAAGYLQYSVTQGEQGLNAFLMKEKSQNPFYSKNFKPEARQGWRLPEWWPSDLKLPDIKLPSLPDLDFVEVYDRPGADPRRRAEPTDERSRLYAALNSAIEAEDYAEAKRLKEQIDDATAPDYVDRF